MLSARIKESGKSAICLKVLSEMCIRDRTLSDAVSAVVPGFDNDPIAEKKMQMVNDVEYAVYPATQGLSLIHIFS